MKPAVLGPTPWWSVSLEGNKQKWGLVEGWGSEGSEVETEQQLELGGVGEV